MERLFHTHCSETAQFENASFIKFYAFPRQVQMMQGVEVILTPEEYLAFKDADIVRLRYVDEYMVETPVIATRCKLNNQGASGMSNELCFACVKALGQGSEPFGATVSTQIVYILFKSAQYVLSIY